MPMTPDEYAAKELNVPGWDQDAPVYAPGESPSEQGIDPNIAVVMNGGPIQQGPAPVDSDLAAMQYEYNLVLPLAIRRAELATELAKQQDLSARTNFWNALAAFVISLVGNAP